jgi:predicted ATP-dependent endonuclease of OLD family
LAEVGEELSTEYQTAELQLAHKDRAGFSEVFLEVVRAVFDRSKPPPAEETSQILKSIRQNLESLRASVENIPSAPVYVQLAALMRGEQAPTALPTQEGIAARILKIYDAALSSRIEAEHQAFRRLRTFQESVNRFMEGKKLIVEPSERAPRRQLARVQLDGERRAGLSVLSSGERHVLTLLFSATHMSAADGVLLIDEPELSLHVDWQRIILAELMAQAGNRQIIACTHAPEVAGDHRHRMVKLQPTPYRSEQGELFTQTPQS